MNVIRCKDWYIGTEKMMEKEDMTVCRSLCKVAVTVVFFVCVINTRYKTMIAGCVFVSNRNPLRLFVVQMLSMYTPPSDGLDNQRIYLFSKN